MVPSQMSQRERTVKSIGSCINSILVLKIETITRLLKTISPVILQFLDNCDGGYENTW